MRRVVCDGPRSRARVETSGALPPTTTFFYDTILPPSGSGHAARRWREDWLKRALAATTGASVVFLDPDTGIAPPSVSMGSRQAGKYIFPNEIAAFAERNQSIVVYQHFNRSADGPEQIKQRHEELMKIDPRAERVVPMVFHRGTPRKFWILARNALAANLDARLRTFLDRGWSNHFDDPRKTIPV